MTKERKSPTILKPMIDENMALQFASAGSSASPPPGKDSPVARSPKHTRAHRFQSGDAGRNAKQILLTLKKDLYEKIAKDAARKGRTVEEHLIRHLTKRYD